VGRALDFLPVVYFVQCLSHARMPYIFPVKRIILLSCCCHSLSAAASKISLPYALR